MIINSKFEGLILSLNSLSLYLLFSLSHTHSLSHTNTLSHTISLSLILTLSLSLSLSEISLIQSSVFIQISFYIVFRGVTVRMMTFSDWTSSQNGVNNCPIAFFFNFFSCLCRWEFLPTSVAENFTHSLKS